MIKQFIRLAGSVAEELPLKQGLKHKRLHQFQPRIVAEELPLKQGLKQRGLHMNVVCDDSCRGTSIKTRIET